MRTASPFWLVVMIFIYIDVHVESKITLSDIAGKKVRPIPMASIPADKKFLLQNRFASHVPVHASLPQMQETVYQNLQQLPQTSPEALQYQILDFQNHMQNTNSWNPYQIITQAHTQPEPKLNPQKPQSPTQIHNHLWIKTSSDVSGTQSAHGKGSSDATNSATSSLSQGRGGLRAILESNGANFVGFPERGTGTSISGGGDGHVFGLPGPGFPDSGKSLSRQNRMSVPAIIRPNGGSGGGISGRGDRFLSGFTGQGFPGGVADKNSFTTGKFRGGHRSVPEIVSPVSTNGGSRTRFVTKENPGGGSAPGFNRLGHLEFRQPDHQLDPGFPSATQTGSTSGGGIFTQGISGNFPSGISYPKPVSRNTFSSQPFTGPTPNEQAIFGSRISPKNQMTTTPTRPNLNSGTLLGGQFLLGNGMYTGIGDIGYDGWQNNGGRYLTLGNGEYTVGGFPGLAGRYAIVIDQSPGSSRYPVGISSSTTGINGMSSNHFRSTQPSNNLFGSNVFTNILAYRALSDLLGLSEKEGASGSNNALLSTILRSGSGGSGFQSGFGNRPGNFGTGWAGFGQSGFGNRFGQGSAWGSSSGPGWGSFGSSGSGGIGSASNIFGRSSGSLTSGWNSSSDGGDDDDR